MKYIKVAALCGSLIASYSLTAVSCKELNAYDETIKKCRKLVQSSMLRYGVPGAVVAVSIDGRIVWSEGIGLADVENNVSCSEDTVMRIASISKSLTAVAVAKAWQQDKLDLDAPIQKYVSKFPEKSVGGVPVTVTLRHLLSHMAGIRHYGKGKEFQNEEYYIKDHYNTVNDSLKLFSNDELLSSPGTSFHYTTHGWTLISAALEAAMGRPFLQLMREEVLRPLHMTSTTEELNSPLLLNRGRYVTHWQFHHVITLSGITTATLMVSFVMFLMLTTHTSGQEVVMFPQQLTWSNLVQLYLQLVTI